MTRTLRNLIAFAAIALPVTAFAQAEYVTIEMEIDVDRTADEVWAKVGGYCDIGEWMSLDCEITSGGGGMGTVRALAGGRVIEILVGKTDLSYGYTQPVQEGRFYNLYHGFLEAVPVTGSTSRLVYTLMYDVSNLADQSAKDADVQRRRTQFEGALANMKRLAEQ